jgi:CheY-like chemotaxis protein
MGKRILFIDGDQTIVEKVNTMLEEMGHQVQMETSGMDALDVFSGNPAGFDLVITDLGMPDISGLRLATRLLKIRGDIPIVLLTGLDGEQLSKARQTGIQWFGIKPISIPALADTVRSALMETAN